METLTLAKEIIRNSILIEGELGFEPEIDAPNKWETIELYRQKGFRLVNIAIGTDMTSLEREIEYISEIYAYVRKNSDKYYIFKNVQEISDPLNSGKLGLMLSFQGAGPLCKNVELVDVFYQLGVKMITIAYNIRNPFGDGCVEPSNSGLSSLGRILVEKLNNTGVIIDLSHTGERTSLDVLEMSKHPVVFSHSNVFAIFQHPRNISDEIIKKVANTGGVIGLNANNLLLGNNNFLIEKYFQHFDHIVQLVGSDHVALGSDIVYFPDLFPQFIAKNSVYYPKNGYTSNSVMKDVKIDFIGPDKIAKIVDYILQKGYSEDTIQKFLGKNYLRLFSSL